MSFNNNSMLDTDSLIHILQFFTMNELNILTGVLFHSESMCITNELYHSSQTQFPSQASCVCKNQLGFQILLASWHDYLWKDYITERINFINENILSPTTMNNNVDHSNNNKNENCCNETFVLTMPQNNFRREFLKQIWNRVQKLNRISKEREERKKYFETLSKKIESEAAKHTPNKLDLSSHQGNDNWQVDDSVIYTPRVAFSINKQRELREYVITEHTIDDIKLQISSLQHELKDFKFPYESHQLKWVIVGQTGIGKTCLMFRTGHKLYPIEWTPTIVDAFSNDIVIPFFDEKFEKKCEKTFGIGYWDSSERQTEYRKMNRLSYPGSDIVTLAFSVDDWKSLKYLAERMVWDVHYFIPSATIIVLGLKKDLRKIQMWKSLLLDSNSNDDSSNVSEPVSYEEGLEFSKRIGAVAYLETSAKENIGLERWHYKLAILRLADIIARKSSQQRKIATQKKAEKTCEVQ
ncbi:hypothetical protein FDP41_003075 [Naegleria fowleri]|uniref:Uncharacterized protein n=1 Tax=Naegleria fowleri TaxID=5763 RepID=A0A6A5BIM7_NAEFO|nr:uncharacterized protein FDP41_003075 [Naegleria fowleri]KAF0977753.1 hypothetical protein FDP41_003075 [Naegleria fowleri]